MKHIKKSMFISTVLMVVMLIAALSTATFAWYTSNNTVTTTATVAGAAQSNDANIGIGWYKGAPNNSITFHGLVDPADDTGDLFPVAPATYYNKYADGDTVANNPADAYITSTSSTVSTGIIADAFGSGVNYKRVVNLSNTDILGTDAVFTGSKVLAKADYVHNPASGKATNWNSSTVDSYATDYKVVYSVTKYAYNNTATTAPATTDIVSVTNHQFSVIASPTSSDVCYEVLAVYAVNNAEGSDNLTDAATSGKVTQLFAYDLVNGGAGHTPQDGYYIVAYKEYMTDSYTSYSSYATAEGYLANAAHTLNDGDISITDVNDPSGIYNLSTPKYDANGFCYLYQIYEHDTAVSTDTQPTNASTFANFVFKQANIDTEGYFKSNAGVANIAQFWTGKTSDSTLAYAADGALAIITGTSSAADGNTLNTFYVTNNSTNIDVASLKVSLNVTGDNAALLRIAIFKDGVYYGTLAQTNNAATTFGTILIGANAADMPTYAAQKEIDLGTLTAGSANAFAIQLVAWFDGTGLNDAAAGDQCSFTLNFAA